jgi:dolichol-phosphate mannosyltransferase
VTRLRSSLGWICAAVDLALFEVLLARGVFFGVAHVASFAIATLTGLALIRGSLIDRAFIGITAAAALLLRGGVLAMFVKTFHVPAAWAILPAIAVSVAAIKCGASLENVSAENRWRNLALAGAAYLALLRLVYLGQAELLPEEAYYWNYAKHMDFGYLDHPPMVAWLIGAGTLLFGNNEFGVRIGAWLCWLVTAFFTFRITRNLLDETTAWCALLLVSALPFFFGVAFIIAPDSPLTACWAAALFFLERALVAQQRGAWLGVGIAMGLGMLSKYSIGLVGLAAGLFLLVDASSRRWFLRWEPYAATLLAFGLFSPVILWNAQHDWASFSYQGAGRAGADPRFSTDELILYIAALLTPTGLAGLLIFAFLKNADTAVRARQMLFMKVFTAAPFAVFAFSSLRHAIKLWWTGPIWLAALPALALGLWQFRQRTSDRWVRASWLPTVMICALAYGVFFHYLALGLPGIGYSTQMNLLPVGWRELARQVELVEKGVEDEMKMKPLVVGMDRNFISSEMAFYDKDESPGFLDTAGINLFGKNAVMYQFWFPAKEQTGRAIVLVAFNENDLTRKAVAKHSERLGPVVRGDLARDGKFIRHYFYRVAYGYDSDRKSDDREKSESLD